MNTLHKSKEYLGVTAPISLSHPKPEELAETEKLIETLKNNNLFESEEEARIREIVLGKLDTLVKEFVRTVYLKRNFSEAVANEAGGKIFTFGSYRLGVHSAGADIDTLCVVPKQVKKEDFFKDFQKILRERPEVEELTAVEEAYVPVMNMEFSGIPIDLVFASIDVNKVGDDLELFDNNLLRNLDEPTARSLNGSRVTDDILRLVPNIPEFRNSLRCIKFWAKRRAVYSNKLGFFGGVAWAILIARVCQLYPNATASSIICKFFTIISQWKWPYPILLKEIESSSLPLRAWNPTANATDRAHRMPIITPSYPSMCSTHNVSASTQHVITQELKRGAEITAKIIAGQAVWDDLFKKDSFFLDYKYYLTLTAYSENENHQLKWSGTIESKVRQLIMGIEPTFDLNYVCPYIKSIDSKFKCESEEAARALIQSKFIGHDPNLDLEEDKTHVTYHTSTFYLGLSIKPRTPEQEDRRQLHFVRPVSEFLARLNALKSTEFSCGVTINSIKNTELPESVFTSEELEIRRNKQIRAAKKAQAKRLREEYNQSSIKNNDSNSIKSMNDSLSKNPKEDLISTSSQNGQSPRSPSLTSKEGPQPESNESSNLDSVPIVKKQKIDPVDELVLESNYSHKIDLDDLAKRPEIKLKLSSN